MGKIFNIGSRIMKRGNKSVRTAKRFWISLSICLLSASLPIALPSAQAEPVCGTPSPRGKVMVLTINIQEKDVDGDPRGDALSDAHYGNEVNVFAKRVASDVSVPPDVILVQEVLGVSADRLIAALKTEVGCDYKLASEPNRNPDGVDLCNTTIPLTDDSECGTASGLEIQRDTAILYNENTMDLVPSKTHDNNNDGHPDSELYSQGYFRTRYPEAVRAEGEPYVYRDQAFACVTEANGAASLPVVSLHYVQEKRFDTPAHNNRRKDIWSQQLANHLVGRCNWAGLPETAPESLRVIGGDFNIKRCPDPDETPHCGAESPLEWWANLKNTAGYTDSVYAKNTSTIAEQRTALGQNSRSENGPRIDFVFVSDSRICTATADTEYSFPERANTPENLVYYSDHAYVKAMLGDPC